jgi:hypothetical protein
MSREISPVLSESFEDVLTAVQETARGRWFLDEYAVRRKSEDTATILAAVAKLEVAMSRMPASGPGSEPEILARARSAIIQAKAQIRGFVPDESPLSKEAQLFARLAELSRQALADAPQNTARQTLGRSMEVAFKLVDHLETNLFNTGLSQLSPGSTKFFQQDAELFEPTKKPNLQAVPDSPAPAAVFEKSTEKRPSAPQDIVLRGAKLTINRTANHTGNPADAAETDGASPNEPVNLTHDTMVIENTESQSGRELATGIGALSAPNVGTKPQTTLAPEHRSVVVNRKADDAIDVPLFDKPANQSAA